MLERMAVIPENMMADSTAPKVCIDVSMREMKTLYTLRALVNVTIKFLHFWTPENFAVIYLKFKQRGKTY